MRKFIKTLLMCVLTAGMLWTTRTTCMAVTANASLVASSTTVEAGQTVSVILNVSGDNIHGATGRLIYNKDFLTLQKVERVLSTWDVSVTNNVLYAEDTKMNTPVNGTRTLCRFTFKVSSNAQQGNKLTLSLGNLSLSDGNRDYLLSTQSVTLTVKGAQSADNKLSSLTISDVTLNFSPNLTEYDAEVPYSVSQVTVNAAAADAGATVTIRYNGVAVSDGVVNLREGSSNYISVEVKAANGSTRTYNVQVTRAKAGTAEPPFSSTPPVSSEPPVSSQPLSDNNLLKNLSVSGLTIGFSPKRTEYDANVDHSVKTVTVLAEAQDPNAKITLKYNGATVNGDTITLRDGANYIGVVVQAENGTTKTYNIEIRRSKDTSSEPSSSEPVSSEQPPSSSEVPPSSEEPTSSDEPSSSDEPVSSDEPSSSDTTTSAPESSDAPGSVIRPQKDLSGLVMHTAYIGGMVLCLLAGCLLGYFICERRKD